MPHPLDTQDMESVILRSPHQFDAGMAAAEKVQVDGGPFANVLLAGMGGSWMAAALLNCCRLTRVPMRIHRNYDLPIGLECSNTLVLVCSFSGNTEETLSAFEAARKRKLAVIGIASGGELLRRCRSEGVPAVHVPADPPTIQPRCATGYFVGILAKLLAEQGLLTTSLSEFRQLPALLSDRMEAVRRKARELVTTMDGAAPVVYASEEYGALARIWKIKFNENAKTPAFWNVFPELNHNEMIGWTKQCGPFHLIMLLDPDADSRIVRRQRVTGELLAELGLQASSVTMEGASRTEKVFSTVLLGDWASYELALRYGVDPSPVQMVEDFKRRLAEGKKK